eukprot:g23619.t1
MFFQNHCAQAAIRKWLPCVFSDQDCEQLVPGSLAKAFSSGRRKRGCGCDEQVPQQCQTLDDGQELRVRDCLLRIMFTTAAQ